MKTELRLELHIKSTRQASTKEGNLETELQKLNLSNNLSRDSMKKQKTRENDDW